MSSAPIPAPTADAPAGPGVTLHLSAMQAEGAAARVAAVVAGWPKIANPQIRPEGVYLEPARGADLAGLAVALTQAGHAPVARRLTLAVDGMTCAACTGRVERILAAQPGVAAAVANLALRRTTLTLWGDVPVGRLTAALAKAGYDAAPATTPPDPGAEAVALGKRAALAIALTLPLFAVEMGGHLFTALHHWLHMAIGTAPLGWGEFVLATAVLFGPGLGFFTRGARALVQGGPDMNSLVAIGAGAAWAYSALVVMAPNLFPATAQVLYFEAAATIVALILLGRTLEARARGRAGAAIAALAQLQPATARLENGVDLPVGLLQPGSRIVLRPGERLPADGVVVQGRSALDESLITGEAMPVAKSPGDSVTAGTLNGAGALVIEVRAVGEATLLSRIGQMVEEAQGQKLPVQAVVDRITAWFVPSVMAVAALAVGLWLAAGQGVAAAMVAGVSVLIIACPCAMGLAVPVSILIATGRGARQGILLRNGAVLQRLAHLRHVAFDKTGTLTLGHPVVTDARVDDALLAAAAGVEAGSEHPLGAALMAHARARDLLPQAMAEVRADPGLGVSGQTAQGRVMVGSARYFDGVDPDLARLAQTWAEQGKSVLFLGRDGQATGALALADPVKPNAARTIAALRAMGVGVSLISGDARAAAEAVGRTLGIDDVQAGVLPGQKADVLRQMGAGLPTGTLAFVGDGVNDAPALATAGVGIAMGTGTDVAMAAGDIVLVSGDPLGVAQAAVLARATMANIRQNLIWAFGYNALLVPVAAGVLVPFGGPGLQPMLGAAAMALSSLCVLGNALRLVRLRLPAA